MVESKKLFYRQLPSSKRDHLINAFFIFYYLAITIRIVIAIKTGRHAPKLAWISLGLCPPAFGPTGFLLFVIYRHQDGGFSALDTVYIVFSVLSVGFFVIYVPLYYYLIGPFAYQAWVASFDEYGASDRRYWWWWKVLGFARFVTATLPQRAQT